MQAFRMPVLIAAFALGIGACDSDSTGPNGDESRVTVHLTDAPGDVLEAVVTIEEIYLQGEGRVTLSSTPQTIDLVQLNNVTAVVVDDEPVPAGQYSELRFVISGGYLRVEAEGDETEIYASSPNYEGLPEGVTVTGNLQMPSLGQSGLKVDFDGAIDLTGEETELLVDFDVSQSFGHQAGNSGMWVMHPVVKGAVLAEAGEVTVTLGLGNDVVLPSIGGTLLTLAHFKASLDGEEVAFAEVDGAFQASFAHVLPGTYSLNVVGPAGLTFVISPVLPMDVTVGSGAEATAALTITSAVATAAVP